MPKLKVIKIHRCKICENAGEMRSHTSGCRRGGSPHRAPEDFLSLARISAFLGVSHSSPHVAGFGLVCLYAVN